MEEFSFRIYDQMYVNLNVMQILNDYQENNSYQLKLYTSNKCYLLEKEYFQDFIKNKLIINDDIKFNKVNIEFYDFLNEEFINQDDDILGEHHIFYKIPLEFLSDEQQLTIKISPAQMNKFDQLKYTLQEIDDFQSLQNNLVEKQNQIYQTNNTIYKQLDDINKKVQQKYNQSSEQNKEKMIILYSNPILQQSSSNNEYEPANFIDFETEIMQILELQKYHQSSIDIECYQATQDNLIKVIKLQPSIIHIIANGGYDLKTAQYYLEFNEKGLVDKLYVNNFAKILQENEIPLLKIKLICISSIIGIKIAKTIQQINQNIPIVSAQKLWNKKNTLALEFWKLIYTQIFQHFTFTKECIEDIKKILNEKQKEKSMCCCLHEHQKECLENYQNIGYQKFHEQHKGISFHLAATAEQKLQLEQHRLNIIQLQKQLTPEQEQTIKKNAGECLCCCKFYEFYLKPDQKHRHQFLQYIYIKNLEGFKLEFNNFQQNQINDKQPPNFKNQVILQNNQNDKYHPNLTNQVIFIDQHSVSNIEVVIEYFEQKNKNIQYQTFDISIPDLNDQNSISNFENQFIKSQVILISKITDDMLKNETIKKFIQKLIENDNSQNDRIILFEITKTIQKELFQEKGKSYAFQFLEFY